MIRCEHCGSPLPDGAIICGECGRSVSVGVSRRPADVTPADTPQPPPLRQPAPSSDADGQDPDSWLPETTLDPATRAWLTGAAERPGPDTFAPRSAPSHVHGSGSGLTSWTGRPTEPSLDPDAPTSSVGDPATDGPTTADDDGRAALPADDGQGWVRHRDRGVGARPEAPSSSATSGHDGGAPAPGREEPRTADEPTPVLPASWSRPEAPTPAPAAPSWWVGRSRPSAAGPVADASGDTGGPDGTDGERETTGDATRPEETTTGRAPRDPDAAAAAPAGVGEAANASGTAAATSGGAHDGARGGSARAVDAGEPTASGSSVGRDAGALTIDGDRFTTAGSDRVTTAGGDRLAPADGDGVSSGVGQADELRPGAPSGLAQDVAPGHAAVGPVDGPESGASSGSDLRSDETPAATPTEDRIGPRYRQDDAPAPGDTAVVFPERRVAPRPVPLVAPGQQGATCHVCGHPLEPDDIFCEECGAVVPAVTAAYTGPVVPLPVERPDWAVVDEDGTPGPIAVADTDVEAVARDHAHAEVATGGGAAQEAATDAAASGAAADDAAAAGPGTDETAASGAGTDATTASRAETDEAAAGETASADDAGSGAPTDVPRRADDAPAVPPIPGSSAAPAPLRPTLPPIPPAPGLDDTVRSRPERPAPEDPDDVEATRIVTRAPERAPVVLHFSTGERVGLRGGGLLGRLPRPEPGERIDEVITIADPGKSVSKTHLELGRDGDDLWVSDRWSGNGTVIRHVDGSIRRCEPGRRYRVERGARVDIGEQFFLVQ